MPRRTASIATIVALLCICLTPAVGVAITNSSRAHTHWLRHRKNRRAHRRHSANRRKHATRLANSTRRRAREYWHHTSSPQTVSTTTSSSSTHSTTSAHSSTSTRTTTATTITRLNTTSTTTSTRTEVPASNPVVSEGLGWEGFGGGVWPGAGWRPFASSSPFNIGTAGASVDPQSEQIVNRVLQWGLPGQGVFGVSETSEDWMHPVYFSTPNDPVYTLQATEPWGSNSINGMKIHIPSTARPAGGSDGHMAVITPEGWEYDFWRVSSKPTGGGTMTFAWGGRLPVTGSGVGGGATAANFGLTAGIIRPQELEAGQIDHALFIVLKCTSATGEFGFGERTAAAGNANSSYVAPATQGGARCSSGEAGAPPMGAWFKLALSDEEIEALNVPAWRKAIFRALADYGGFVGDTGGPGFALQYESGSSYTSLGLPDPWVTFAKKHGLPQSGGHYLLNLSEGINWQQDLRVLTPPAA